MHSLFQHPSDDCSAPTLSKAVVLDTNVVLDWMLFRDPSCASLAACIEGRLLRWHATLPMRNELAAVLPRPQLQAWDGEQVLGGFDQWAQLTAAQPNASAPRCRDGDDQKFIDLACTLSARWLLTRDRALLDLAKSARRHGVAVLTPAEWTLRHGAAPELASRG
jgi:predicted nucleic acid-binding protein